MRYFEVKGYWKDDKQRIDGYIMVIGDYDEDDVNDALDDKIAYYFDGDAEMLSAKKLDSGFEFVLERFEEISLNWTVEKKDEVEKTLIKRLTSMGMDLPNNFEDIVQYCYEDVCETADPRDWSDGDVMIAFRRWVEKQGEAQSKTYTADDMMNFGLWLGEQYKKRGFFSKPKTIDELFKVWSSL